MGLDMVPLGKPKPGFESRFQELFEIFGKNEIPKASFLDKLMGRKFPTKEELTEEWFSIQIESYETIKAPRVGRDQEANLWIKAKYNQEEHKMTLDEFMKEHQGYYVIELAKELDGVPSYISFNHDRNVFRGQFLNDCMDLIGENLVKEAWVTKTATETLDYGNRLMEIANKIFKENDLDYLKELRFLKDIEPESYEAKLHILYSAAKWLIFCGRNGHGYHADY